MRIGDRYELERPLGEGGMAGVFLARDVETGAAVAIKQMHAELGAHQELRARFLREGRIVARLTHPHVVAIHDVLPVDETGIAMVMEFVEGCDLAAVIKRNPPLAMVPELALRVLRPVAEALAYVHGEGIIHRDVKPANVLLGADGAVKLTDFGIARGDDDQSLTQTGDFLGTPAYIPPEQARGLRVTAAADQYALGVMLYQLVTGEKPFAARSTAEIVLAILRNEYPDPRERCAAVDDGLAAIINRAMSPEPGDRFPDMAAFIAALDAWHTPDPEGTPATVSALVADPEGAAAAFARQVAEQLAAEGEVARDVGDRATARARAHTALTRHPQNISARALLTTLGEEAPDPLLLQAGARPDAIGDDDTVFDPRGPALPGDRTAITPPGAAAEPPDRSPIATAETDPAVDAIADPPRRAPATPSGSIGRASPADVTVLKPATPPPGVAGWKILLIVFVLTGLIGGGIAWIVHSQPPTAPPKPPAPEASP